MARLRNSTIRALRFKDVKKELEAGLDIIMVPVYPEMKELVPGACKGNIPYFTFFPAETVKALRRYLEKRKYCLWEHSRRSPTLPTEDTKIRKELRNLNPLSQRTRLQR